MAAITVLICRHSRRKVVQSWPGMTSLQFAGQLRVSYSPPPSLVTQIIAVVVDTTGARLIIGALACLSTAQRGRAKGECSQIMYSARSLGNPLFGLITFAWATGREIRNADQRISIALVAKLLSFWRSCLREHWTRGVVCRQHKLYLQFALCL
jgi:hypothetical protein